MVDFNPYAKAVHDPYNYAPRPHFERKDRGQGTLFQVQQFPHGYGPSRSRSVDESRREIGEIKRARPDAEPETLETVTGGPRSRSGQTGAHPAVTRAREINAEGSQGKVFAARTQAGWGVNAEAVQPAQRLGQKTKGEKAALRAEVRGKAESKLVGEIKRSSIPTEHLQNVTFELGRGGNRGGYYSSIGTDNIGGPAISLSDSNNETSTLHHEVGHHVDFQSLESRRTGAIRERKFVEQPEETAVMKKGLSKVAKEFLPNIGVREPEQRAWVDQEFNKRMDRDDNYGVGVRTGTQEGFADSYRAHHVPEATRSQYSKSSLHANVNNMMSGRYGHDSPFLLGRAGEKNQAVRAYEHERHRWGQQPSWESGEPDDSSPLHPGQMSLLHRDDPNREPVIDDLFTMRRS